MNWKIKYIILLCALIVNGCKEETKDTKTDNNIDNINNSKHIKEKIIGKYSEIKDSIDTRDDL